MGDEPWREADHPRDGNGRFVSSGTIWFIEKLLAAHLELHDSHDLAHGERHASEQKAIELAAETIKTWKAESNEWRGTLTDRDRAYAKVGDVVGIEGRLRLIETANERRDATERERLVAESREKQEADRRASRQYQLLGFAIGIPAFIGAVAGVIALIRGGG